MMRMRTMSKASRSRYSHITPLSLERRAVRAFGNVRTGGGSVGDGGGGRCGGVTGGCYSYSLDTLERPRVPAPQGGSGTPGGGTAGGEGGGSGRGGGGGVVCVGVVGGCVGSNPNVGPNEVPREDLVWTSCPSCGPRGTLCPS